MLKQGKIKGSPASDTNFKALKVEKLEVNILYGSKVIL